MNDRVDLSAAMPTLAPQPGVGRGLLGDYNGAAKAYWWLLVVAGTAVVAGSLASLMQQSPAQCGQIIAMSALAAIVGIFPLRIPKSKNSIAAGDIFIFLPLLLYGPAAAVLAATAEAAVCAWRTSNRGSSRIVSPAAAAVAMLACGNLFDWFIGTLAGVGVAGDAVVFGGALLFALVYLAVSPTLVTTVIYLKRRRGPTLAEWVTSFGWLSMGYLGSASIAGVLYLAFRQFGVASVLVATPMIALFLTTLHYYFAQQLASEREAAERVSRERAETAAREAAQAALHLRELELSDRRFHSAFTHAAIGMALVADDGRVVQSNSAMCGLLGRDCAEVVGAAFLDFIEPDDAATLERQLQRVRSAELNRFQLELRCGHSEGREVWASLHCGYFAHSSTSESHLIFQAFDVTARRLAEGTLQHLAYHDSLTNLANRRRLQDAVALAIEGHRAEGARQYSVLHLNFDRFKLLNDSLGHGAGDEFLVKVARRLREHVRPSDVLARLGGDEFAILTVHSGRGAHHAIALAERLQQAFRLPILVGETEVSTGVSIGITFGDVGYRNPDEALRDADLAMSKAKASGKARYALFDPSLHVRASEHLRLETELRRALAGEQLTLAFQPVFGIAPRRLVGFEALARWQHPTRGAISPGTFIPVAEESGLIVQLTNWAIRRACQQLHQWRERFDHCGEIFVNVNIAGQDLCEPRFAEQVQELLELFELPPACLTLEITETTLMRQLEAGGKALARLREIGVGLSVDDFGTGYSSLSHLSTLPINSLKIDRSFVEKLDGASGEIEIVRAVVQLGHALGKRVVAEGVETAVQLESLRGLGCGYAQGFLLARPLGEAQATALLADLAPAGEPNAAMPVALLPSSTSRANLIGA